MLQHAKAASARIFKSYPKGFELDGEHAPHITMLQRYVKTSELGHLFEAVAKVFATSVCQVTAFDRNFGDK